MNRVKMINLKQPMFWASSVYIAYVFFNLIAVLIFSPNSVIAKFFLGMLGLLLFILVIAVYRKVIRRTVPSSAHILLTVYPYIMVFLGLFHACLGSLSLRSFLDLLAILPPGFLTPWQMYMNVSGSIMLPVGVLVFIFSVLHLIINRRSVQPKI